VASSNQQMINRSKQESLFLNSEMTTANTTQVAKLLPKSHSIAWSLATAELV